MTVVPIMPPTFDTRLEGVQPEFFKPNITSDIINEDKKNPFDTFFQAALDVIRETNLHQLEADQWQLDLATGRTDDILAVQMAQDKAYTSLNFTVQVTTKIIESYREIMRMQL